MTAERIRAQIEERLCLAGVEPVPAQVEQLRRYLALLGHWNDRINLTAFQLDPPGNDAVDRLIVEPVVAARFVGSNNQYCIDIGSGGGSPAIPMKIVCPLLRLTMVEARVRKCAFLREAVRTLGLDRTHVETARFDISWVKKHGTRADLLTMRAVRIDAALWRAIDEVVDSSGRIFHFGSLTDADYADSAIPDRWVDSVTLQGGPGGHLVILARRP